MKVYLDNCTFNRPFDDQQDIRIRIETEAKLHIQEQIRNNKLRLIWSYILDFENEENPFIERKESISLWKNYSFINVVETENILQTAENLTKIGLRAKDALHIASAMEAKANYFLTTDDKILNKASKLNKIVVLNPIDFIKNL